MTGEPLEVEVAEKMVPFATQAFRHKVARGGRGSAKSQSISRILVARGVARRSRVLCCRETQKSIRESSKRLLENAIRVLNLGAFYDVQDQIIRGPHGTEFVFAGLRQHTADSLKSYEDFDIAWIAEAHAISSESANILIPTIRAHGSELWWDYNPDQESDYIHKEAERAVRDKDPDTLVVNMNWRDNKWFPRELEKERLKLKAVNSDLYEHIWEGKLRTLAGLLFKRRWFKWYDTLPANLSKYLSSDYAGAPDPNEPEGEPDNNELGVFGLNEVGDLYICDWWYDQCDYSVMLESAITMIRRHGLKIWFEEKGPVLRSIDSSIRKDLREHRDAKGKADPIHIHREQLSSINNKAERALGFAARASSGSVYLPRNQPWAERLVNQLCAFTGEDGKVDDGVDVCSLLARGLDVMANAREPSAATDRLESVVPFSRRHFEAMEHDDKERDRRKKNYYR